MELNLTKHHLLVEIRAKLTPNVIFCDQLAMLFRTYRKYFIYSLVQNTRGLSESLVWSCCNLLQSMDQYKAMQLGIKRHLEIPVQLRPCHTFTS